MNYVGLIFALALGAAGILLANWFADWNKAQTCVTSGRRDCVRQLAEPVETAPTIWVPAPRRAP